MNQSQAKDTPTEPKPFMVVVHEGRHGRNLHRVCVIGRVLKQSIVGVEEFPGKQEEELP